MGAGRAHRRGLFRKAARRRLDAASERALRRRRPFGRSNEPVEHADDRANLIALTRQRLFRREQRPARGSVARVTRPTLATNLSICEVVFSRPSIFFLISARTGAVPSTAEIRRTASRPAMPYRPRRRAAFPAMPADSCDHSLACFKQSMIELNDISCNRSQSISWNPNASAFIASAQDWPRQLARPLRRKNGREPP